MYDIPAYNTYGSKYEVCKGLTIAKGHKYTTNYVMCVCVWLWYLNVETRQQRKYQLNELIFNGVNWLCRDDN